MYFHLIYKTISLDYYQEQLELTSKTSSKASSASVFSVLSLEILK